MSRYVPSGSAPLAADVRASAGIEQALDLLGRSESDAPGAIGERDYLRRAIVQLFATQSVAQSAGLNDVATAAATAMEALDAAVAAFDAAEPYASFLEDGRASLSEL
jgi:hypothetical protein